MLLRLFENFDRQFQRFSGWSGQTISKYPKYQDRQFQIVLDIYSPLEKGEQANRAEKRETSMGKGAAERDKGDWSKEECREWGIGIKTVGEVVFTSKK